MKRYLVFSLLLAVLFSRILFIQPTKQIIGDGGDNYEFFGYMYVAHDNLAHLKYPFAHSTLMRYPGGFDFSYGYDGAFTTLTGAFLSFIAPLPLAFNLTIVAILWLNLFISFYFFRKLAHLVRHVPRNDLQYFIAGLIFGWSPFVFGRMNGHLNLATVAGLPIFVYFLVKFLRSVWKEEKLKFADLLGVGLGLLAISFGSLQYIVLGIEFGLSLLIFIIVVFWETTLIWIKRFIKLLNPSTILAIGAAFFLTVVGFLLFFYGFLWAMFTHNFSTQGITYINADYIPSVVGFLIPNGYLGNWWTIFNQSKPQVETVCSLGIIPLILFIFFTLRLKNKKLIAGIIALIGFFVLAVSLFHLPLVPERGRLVVFILLTLTVLWSIYEERIGRKTLILILLLLIAEHTLYYIHVSPPMPWEAAKIVSSNAGSAVLNVPLLSDFGSTDALPYLWRKSIVDGYFLHAANNLAANTTLNDPQIQKFFCDKNRTEKFSQEDVNQLYSQLKKLDISTVVLFKQGLNQLWWYPKCKNVRDWWDYFNPPKATPSEEGTQTLLRFEYGRNAPIHSHMVFDYNGSFEIDGLTLWPPQINDFSLQTPDGKIITPNWHMASNNKDLVADFNPPLVISVATGSAIKLFSHKTVDSNTYVGLYYKYEPAEINNFLTPKKASLRLIWKDDADWIEVYSIINN